MSTELSSTDKRARSLIGQAISRLSKSAKGLDALKTIKPFLNSYILLDTQNQDACIELMVGCVQGYAGTVFESLEAEAI